MTVSCIFFKKRSLYIKKYRCRKVTFVESTINEWTNWLITRTLDVILLKKSTRPFRKAGFQKLQHSVSNTFVNADIFMYIHVHITLTCVLRLITRNELLDCWSPDNVVRDRVQPTKVTFSFACLMSDGFHIFLCQGHN